MAPSLSGRLALFAALVAGACLGGWTAGLLKSRRASPAQLAKCFAGGTLMGWGSLMIPGGNDGLILVGLPLLWPNAWVGVGVMALTIYAAFQLQRFASRRIEGAT
jgi:toxin CptA